MPYSKAEQDEWDKRMLEQDRDDLLGLLQMRFGTPPPNVLAKIHGIKDGNTISRLILVAANAVEWRVFIEELQSGDGSFKILGERYSPH